MTLVQYADLFTNTRFEAPEGVLTAQIKNEATVEPDRAQLLLWFYDPAGKPLADNLTLVVSRSALNRDSDGEYRREVVAAVERWLASERKGEPIQVLL